MVRMMEDENVINDDEIDEKEEEHDTKKRPHSVEKKQRSVKKRREYCTKHCATKDCRGCICTRKLKRKCTDECGCGSACKNR